MKSLMILAAETANEATVVNEFEQTLLRVFILIIMFGLGAGLTPKDFTLALRRPWGLAVGWVAQFGIMPLTAYVLVVAVLIPFSPPEGVLFIALGALIMGSVPAGTTSNLFTYFSKGNVALSVTMTVNSTLWAFIMTPLALWAYSNLLGLDESLSVPTGELATVIVGLIIPVGIGMLIRKLSANIGSMIELIGSIFGLLFIPFLIAVWVPRNWQLLLDTQWPTYVVAIGLGAVGMTTAYFMSKALRLHPANARTIALEAGINNGPLAIAVIVAVYIDNPGLDQILLIPALYSLFIVLLATVVTLIFRRANVAAEQKIPNLL